MKKIFLICVVVFANNLDALHISGRGSLLKHYPPPPPESTGKKIEAITEETFTQKLDHFDPTNTDTWSQRYFANDVYFNTIPRNVVFLMLGGEGAASETWMRYGPWVASARKYHALLFQLEHRFYGESQPFSDLSLEHLRYLSSQQALADAAYFIASMNKKYRLPSDVKWILFGGSYSGSLVAWMRLKYPHLVHGAMSASGPLFAKFDFSEYMQVVVDDMALSSQECVDSVRVAVEQVESLLTNPGDETVTELFNLCDPIEENLDDTLSVANFFQTITEAFAAIAQYNNVQGRGSTIDDLCDIVTNKSYGTEIERLAILNRAYYGANCLGYDFDDIVDYLKSTEIRGGDRQWIYQTCTEYGWYQTSDQEEHVFGNRFNTDFYTNLCTQAYGELFNETFIIDQIERTNTDYGALDIKSSNIVYVHGSIDPWHAVGLIKTTNLESPAIYINGTAHCANMYDESPKDVPALIAARAEIDRLIGVWLGLSGQ